MGKSSSKYARLMNRFNEESCRGLGTLLHPLTDRFETSTYHVIIIDSSGHRNFMKNMITGSSQVCFSVVFSYST